MNSKANYILILAVVTVSTANTIGRLTIPPAPGPVTPGNPEPPSISVNLASDILMTTLGFTGSANANQQVSESVQGNSNVPASLSSMTSTSASVAQSGTTDEVAIVDVPEETVSSINSVNTEFLAEGSEEILAAMYGLNASVEYSGDSAVPLGGGVTLTDATTDIEIITKSES